MNEGINEWMNEWINKWMVYSQSDPFQGITEVQNKIQCSKRNKQSRVIQCLACIFV